MVKYLLRRLLHGLISVVIVVGIVMVLIYSLMDRKSIFIQDSNYTKIGGNAKEVYKYQSWEEYGYLDYVPYADYIAEVAKEKEAAGEEFNKTKAAKIGNSPDKDTEIAAEYIKKFTELYESQGYTIVRLDAKYTGKKIENDNKAKLFAYKDTPLASRLWSYFSNIIHIESIYDAKDFEGTRKIEFTLHDPVYNGKFAPAVIGHGTEHQYLLYFDNQFPFIHQNLVSIQLGISYSEYKGKELTNVMTNKQGSIIKSEITYPTGYTEESSIDLHTATYVSGSSEFEFNIVRFGAGNNYTDVSSTTDGLSMVGNSFVIGIISTFIAYFLGIPLGILMARHKGKLADKLGTIYIIFIIAVPSLAYIFMIRFIGGKLGAPTNFANDAARWKLYILPIISLALPSIGGLMKWLRRYMIDQMNSDYVKFARAGGLSEGEIFRKHILKNAAIPIVHGIPGSILGSLVGAIVTERVYAVPGAGKLLTSAINKYDNGIIVGLTFFYAILSIVSLILGDMLMALVDPRISFSSKGR